MFCLTDTSFSQEKRTLRDFIKPPVVDQFNQLVRDNDRKNINPTPGGQIIIRLPLDPTSLNPITDNSAHTQVILGYIFDSMITRHSETLEWLPWLAKYWQEKDLITLKNGSSIEGRILSDNDGKILFAENEGKLVIGKQDVEKIDLDTGKIITKEGKEYSGKIAQYEFTIEIEPVKSNKSRIIYPDEIAQSIEHNNKKAILKNSVYYFTIRDGVKWHDGVNFTVEDIKFSFDTIMNGYVDAAPLRSYYNDIKQLQIVDKQTVKFVYGKSYFLSLNLCGGIPIFPRHVYKPEQFGSDKEAFGKYFNESQINRNPIGNSCYRFISWEKGKNIVLQKVNDYWASTANLPYWKKGQPYLDKIVFTIINNKTSALKELQNGNVDMDLDIEPDIWFMPQTTNREFTSKFVRAYNIVPMYSYIGWNMDKVFFKDRKVRQAMSHLIPLEKIAKDIHRGLVLQVTGPFYINGPIYDHSLKPYDFSLKKAKKLLRETGWVDHDGDGIIDKDGLEFEFEYLIHNGRDYHQKIADIIKESIERAGIKMLIRKIDWTIFAQTVADRKFDAVRFAWGSGIDDDPYQIWHSSQIENHGSNYVGYRNPTVDQILEQGRETFDPIARWSLYRQLHRILYEDQPYTFMFCFQTLIFYNNKFRNVKLYCTQPGYDLREWYIQKSDNK